MGRFALDATSYISGDPMRNYGLTQRADGSGLRGHDSPARRRNAPNVTQRNSIHLPANSILNDNAPSDIDDLASDALKVIGCVLLIAAVIVGGLLYVGYELLIS